MNESKFEELIAEKTGVDIETVDLVINAFKCLIVERMQLGLPVKLSGLGMFWRAKRKGTATWKGVKYAYETFRIAFRCSEAAKDKLNETEE